MGINSRYRLEKPGTWQDGLEFLNIMAVSICAFTLFTQWLVPLATMLPIMHLYQVAKAMGGKPLYEWALMTMFMDIVAFSLQWAIHLGYVPPIFRLDAAASDSPAYNILKLALLGGLIFVSFARFWQCLDNEDEMVMRQDGSLQPAQPVYPEHLTVRNMYGHQHPQQYAYAPHAYPQYFTMAAGKTV